MVSLGLVVSLVSLQALATTACEPSPCQAWDGVLGFTSLEDGCTDKERPPFHAWDRIVPVARWIASGTVSRELLEGDLVVTVRETLKGEPPSELTVRPCPYWERSEVRVGTPIVVYLHPSGEIAYRLQIEPQPDWLEQVAGTVRMRLELEAASSNVECTESLREMLATGLEEPIFAATGFALLNPEAADYRALWPDLLRAARTARSSWSADQVLHVLKELAEAEDVADLVRLLDCRDHAFQLRVLESLRYLTSPFPPIPPKSDSVDVPAVREQLLSWFEAHRARLHRRQRSRY